MNFIKYILGISLSVTLLNTPCIEAKKVKADYIVIGIGTAGATIANRLSDDMKTSVLAIHDGKNENQNPDIKFTRNTLFTVSSALFGSSFYQTGETPPQPNAGDQQIFWCEALPLGGASAINAGAYCRGTNDVYAQWEAIAGPEWSVARITDTYIEIEKYQGTSANPEFRGTNGPLKVRQNPDPTKVSQTFTEAIIAATGFPFVDDYNDPLTPIGASSQMQYTQRGKDGELRESSATVFLNKKVMKPDGYGVKGRKLRVIFESKALRTIWEGDKAIGVEYFRNGKIKKAYARKGVIVCAGLQSSAFLMHSGIGPKPMLEALGIPVVFDNPNVGKGLADQPLMPLLFLSNPNDTPISGSSSSSTPGNPIKGLKLGSIDIAFPFIFPVVQGVTDGDFLSGILSPSLQFPSNSIFADIAFLPDPNPLIDQTKRALRFSTSNPVPGVTFAMFDMCQPQSRGRISLGSFDPLALPIVDLGTFSNPADLDLYVRGFQTYIKNIDTALQDIDSNYGLIFPDRALLDDTKLLREFIRETVGSAQCFQSHCRMAPLDQGGVVDNTGHVHGVRNLIVADNSINPVPMDGTPMATGYLIAFNLARLLQE